MRIHFASIVNAELDLDLLEHWAKYYQGFGFDTYKVWLHSTNPEKFSKELHLAEAIFRTYHFMCERIEGDFRAGQLRSKALYPYQLSLPDRDYLVISDSDEFQQVQDYRKELEGKIALLGHLVDKFDTTLHDAIPSIPISEQFPNTGIVEKLIRRTLRWPVLARSKVLVARIDCKMELQGSHFVTGKNGEDLKLDDKYEVHHYSFRKSYPYRMLGKEYYTSEHIAAMIEFFHGSYDHPALNARQKQEEELQQKMGWIPCR